MEKRILTYRKYMHELHKSRVIGKQALQDNCVVIKYSGMDFSRHAEAGHSDPFLVSGGYQGSPLRERRNYDF